MTNLRYQQDCENVDWVALKQTLLEDEFDNMRTPVQYETSFRNSAGVIFVYDDAKIIGTARVLSDGVCNAYLVDVWTYTPYRKQGIAKEMLSRLLAPLQGQHVFLFTDDVESFYKKVGFVERGTGFEKVIGQWLVNTPQT